MTAAQGHSDETVTLPILVAEHRPNVVTEEIGVPDGARGDRQWRTRVKCDGYSCDFYAEAPRYWDAVKQHDAHLVDVLLMFLADVLAEARADVLREHADREMVHEGATMAVERLLIHAAEHQPTRPGMPLGGESRG